MAAIIVTGALNLFYKFEGSYAYSHGLLLDYLLIKIYLSDFLAWALIGVGIWSSWKQKLRFSNTQKLMAGGWVLLSLSQIWLFPHPSSLWFLAKLWQWTLVGIILYIHPNWWKDHLIKTSLAGVIIIETFLSLFQWWFQRSLLPYQFLGETNLHQSFGLASVSWWGSERVLPYGTTAHPNVLGGLLLGYFVWFLCLEKTPISKKTLLLGAITLIGIILTQSASALMGLLLLLIYLGVMWVVKKIKNPAKVERHLVLGTLITLASLLVIIPVVTQLLWKNTSLQSTSLSRRVLLNQATIKLWAANPLTGIGFNQFVTQADPFTRASEIGRFSQPAHHIGLLWLTETGLIGMCFLLASGVVLLRSMISQKNAKALLPLIWLVPIMAFDHYLFTLQTGQWLMVGSLVLMLSLGQNRRA